MKIFIAVLILLAILIWIFMILINSSGKDLGNSRSGFHSPENTKLTAQNAIELAAPFLDDSYAIRRKMRGENQANPHREAVTWLSIKDKWYYVTKDDYPSYTPGYYMHHAVRVNSDTGEVIKPEP